MRDVADAVVEALAAVCGLTRRERVSERVSLELGGWIGTYMAALDARRLQQG